MVGTYRKNSKSGRVLSTDKTIYLAAYREYKIKLPRTEEEKRIIQNNSTLKSTEIGNILWRELKKIFFPTIQGQFINNNAICE